MDTWLKLPTVALFAVLALLLGANAAGLYGVVFQTRAGRWLRRLKGVSPPLLGSVAVLFALLTGFVANDVWERNRQSVRAVLTEATEVRALHSLSIASVSDMADIRRALHAYVRSAIEDEWPSMGHHASSSRTEAALAAVLQQIAQPRITAEAGSAVHGALLATAMRIGTARHDRILLSEDRSDELKWLAVIALALFTQVAIGAVHFESRRAFALALVIFSTASAVTLGLIAMREQPFAGPQLTSPAALKSWLHEVGAGADEAAATSCRAAGPPLTP